MKRNGTVWGVALAVLAISSFVATANAGNCGAKQAQLTKASGDIVDTAVGAGQFKTLVAAVQAAGLVEVLKGDGPFTVFAPTDEAFAKLPEGTVDALLKDSKKLGAILKYHVVAGKVTAADVTKLKEAKTLLGQSVAISTKDGVRIENAKVTATDIDCSNGVIHVIDTVLLPKEDILGVAGSAGQFKTLLTAIEAAGLTDTLRGEGPFTVFAPTDDAFAKLPAGTLDALLKDKEKLRAILTYHVVSGKVMAADVAKLSEAKTLQGSAVRIDTSSGVKVDDARVVKTDICAGNGVIHVIDAVITPPDQHGK
ncbi:MAG: fasciclin domain-containing protein [Phycisphaerae bacterium]|nr:fasciclin domain-containing protein [Phycisphaerae bacterium]